MDNIVTKNCKSNFKLMVTKMATENQKTIITFVSVYLAACLGLGLWIGSFGNTCGAGTFTTYAFISSGVCAFIASKIGFDLTRKESKISMLMTPASTTAKFWPRFIAMVPLMTIVSILGYFVLVYSAVLGLGIFHGEWIDVYLPVYSHAGVDNEYWSLILLMITLFILTESVFTMGAVLWPKLSFLCTLGAIIAFYIVASIFVMFLFWANTPVNFEINDGGPLYWTFIGICYALSVTFVGVAYYGFKKVKL